MRARALRWRCPAPARVAPLLSKRPRHSDSSTNAIVGAYYAIRQWSKYPTDVAAAAKAGASVGLVGDWRRAIQRVLAVARQECLLAERIEPIEARAAELREEKQEDAEAKKAAKAAKKARGERPWDACLWRAVGCFGAGRRRTGTCGRGRPSLKKPKKAAKK